MISWLNEGENSLRNLPGLVGARRTGAGGVKMRWCGVEDPSIGDGGGANENKHHLLGLRGGRLHTFHVQLCQDM